MDVYGLEAKHVCVCLVVCVCVCVCPYIHTYVEARMRSEKGFDPFLSRSVVGLPAWVQRGGTTRIRPKAGKEVFCDYVFVLCVSV